MNSKSVFHPFRLISCAILILCAAGCAKHSDSSDSGARFHLKIQDWNDDSGQFSASDLAVRLAPIIQKLPGLTTKDTPMLFVRGNIHTDETGSVMVLEGRYLFRVSNASAHLPVKVVVMGSIEGTTVARRESLVKGVLKDLKQAISANIRICNGSKKTWIAALKSPEPDEQILALSILRDQKVAAAAPGVIGLLDDPRTEVGQAAAETAAVLASPEHVSRIIRIAQNGGLEVEARCIQVLSSIGGPDAIAWLEMLALGHQNSQLRELSFNALKRLK